MVLGSGGSNCKAFVVFDCCREDFVDLRDRVQKTIESQKNIATQKNQQSMEELEQAKLLELNR